MVKIALVEDNDLDANLLIECMNRYFTRIQEEYSIERYSNSISFLEKYDPSVDIVFMDIELPDLDGLKAAKKMRKYNETSILVFVTNMVQFAVNGYEVNALDFIVKPVKYLIFDAKMNRIMEYVRRKQDDDFKLMLKTATGVYNLQVSRIRYIEVENHELIYHLDKGEKLVARGQIKDIEDRLTDVGFFRCHRCFLVNMKYVTAIKESTVLVEEDELLISRGRKKDFFVAIANYF